MKFGRLAVSSHTLGPNMVSLSGRDSVSLLFFYMYSFFYIGGDTSPPSTPNLRPCFCLELFFVPDHFLILLRQNAVLPGPDPPLSHRVTAGVVQPAPVEPSGFWSWSADPSPVVGSCCQTGGTRHCICVWSFGGWRCRPTPWGPTWSLSTCGDLMKWHFHAMGPLKSCVWTGSAQLVMNCPSLDK